MSALNTFFKVSYLGMEVVKYLTLLINNFLIKKSLKNNLKTLVNKTLDLRPRGLPTCLLDKIDVYITILYEFYF